jgi:hypothetical protein
MLYDGPKSTRFSPKAPAQDEERLLGDLKLEHHLRKSRGGGVPSRSFGVIGALV